MATYAEKDTAELEHGLQDVPERPEVALRRVVALAQAQFPGCVSASVTLVRSGRAMPVVSTSEVARELDSAQCRSGEGPCLDAIRQLQVFNVAVGDHSGSWPGFTKEAMARGIHSSLSVPLTIGGEAVGALNMYGASPEDFAGCEAVAVVYGSRAAATVSGALADIRARQEDRTSFL